MTGRAAMRVRHDPNETPRRRIRTNAKRFALKSKKHEGGEVDMAGLRHMHPLTSPAHALRPV